jgi:uncharacterized protein (DUF1330 family)
MQFYVVIALWIHPGQAASFEAYEQKAAKIMRRYGAKIERTVRLSEADPISVDPPFEVHVLSFPEKAAFASYRNDDELKSLALDRAAAIRLSTIWTGSDGPAYDRI